jgi:hypothetical protein
MTRSLEGIQLRLSLSMTNKVTTSGGRASTGVCALSSNPTVLSGNGISEANRAWEYSATLAESASLVIDLYDLGSLDTGAGAGKDNLGQVMAIDEIVAIAIMNESVSVSTDSDSDSDTLPCLSIEPDATNGWTPIGSHTDSTGGALQSGGVLFKMQIEETAFPVVDGSSHRIKLTTTGGDIDFKILVVGRGA